MADHQQPTPTQIGFILIVGVFAVSTAAIFIRLAIAAADERGLGFSLFLSAFRLLVASLVLLPTWRNLQPNPQAPAALYYAGAAGVCLSCHFVAWITSLSFTSIAASTTLVTTNPIWVSLISWLWFREKPTRTIVLGIAIAFAGGVLIAFGDAGSDVGDRPSCPVGCHPGKPISLIGTGSPAAWIRHWALCCDRLQHWSLSPVAPPSFSRLQLYWLSADSLPLHSAHGSCVPSHRAYSLQLVSPLGFTDLDHASTVV